MSLSLVEELRAFRIEAPIKVLLGGAQLLLLTSCVQAPVLCSGTTDGWIAYDRANPPEHRPILTATLLPDGRVRWAGSEITTGQLAVYLRRSRRMSPSPYLVLQHREGADSARLADLRRMFDVQGGCACETVCSERALDPGGARP